MGPVASSIVAQLRYDYGNTHWAAIVVRGDDGWDLWIQQGDHAQPSGCFTNTKALLKFITEKANTRFSDYKPSIDTLKKLKGKSAQSLVPDCYDEVVYPAIDVGVLGGGKGYDKCPSCAFRHKCGAVVESTLVYDDAAETNEAGLMARVQAKIKAMYKGIE